jgi:hypothetical protein
MKRIIAGLGIFAFLLTAISLFLTLKTVSAGTIVDPIIGISHALKYTDSSYEKIAGTIEGTSYEFGIAKMKTETFYAGVKMYFAQTKPSGNKYEIKKVSGTSGTDHSLLVLNESGAITKEIDISVSDPSGNPIDKGDQPKPPSGESGSTTPTPDDYDGYGGIYTGDLKKPTWQTVFEGKQCDSYECWMGEVWKWSMIIMIPLSVLVLSAAGVLYMVSEGDSNRIGLAKKLILGVFSGIGLLVLARLLLTIIGVDWTL